METNTLYTPEMTWKAHTEFPGKAKVKVLRGEQPGQARTVLIRLHAGGQITPHAHAAVVQHYVLEGEYESEGKIYGAGTYRLLPRHTNVAAIATQNGVTILMIYDPV